MKSRKSIWSLVFCLGVMGCMLPDPMPEAPQPVYGVPDFDDYPAFKIYRDKPRPVNLVSHPRAIRFEGRLVDGAKSGPNFAGRQTVIRWSCGDECQQFGVVDAMTGSVIFAPFVSHLGVRFQLDSRLFIVNPPEAIDRAAREGKPRSYYRTVYYVWHFGRFVEIYSVRYD
ncbi:MAG: hypothetical protein HOE48_05055 [Candidatus Latescibacteria bacterium]|jgi:hypothetical protein|nr:hypothetical protein [Candidatus Latescibacterota bacterium]MBT4137260.1 hypothetical protein [Candidatus Latescibacterota bacterium]MBT5830087.1 hypothetical protein [Candidatus Latescibacterota bacterium]